MRLRRFSESDVRIGPLRRRDQPPPVKERAGRGNGSNEAGKILFFWCRSKDFRTRFGIEKRRPEGIVTGFAGDNFLEFEERILYYIF